MRVITDADFDNISRYLSLKLEIFFDTVPLVVTKENYLIDASWLEEAGTDYSRIWCGVL